MAHSLHSNTGVNVSHTERSDKYASRHEIKAFVSSRVAFFHMYWDKTKIQHLMNKRQEVDALSDVSTYVLELLGDIVAGDHDVPQMHVWELLFVLNNSGFLRSLDPWPLHGTHSIDTEEDSANPNEVSDTEASSDETGQPIDEESQTQDSASSDETGQPIDEESQAQDSHNPARTNPREQIEEVDQTEQLDDDHSSNPFDSDVNDSRDRVADQSIPDDSDNRRSFDEVSPVSHDSHSVNRRSFDEVTPTSHDSHRVNRKPVSTGFENEYDEVTPTSHDSHRVNRKPVSTGFENEYDEVTPTSHDSHRVNRKPMSTGFENEYDEVTPTSHDSHRVNRKPVSTGFENEYDEVTPTSHDSHRVNRRPVSTGFKNEHDGVTPHHVVSTSEGSDFDHELGELKDLLGISKPKSLSHAEMYNTNFEADLENMLNGL
jgi:hypothetical protein